MRTEPAELVIGGVDATELARTYGTPLLAIDTDTLDTNIARYETLARELDIDVCYAGKALLFVGLARRIARSVLGLDVCSLGELLTGERAGMPAARMVLHGCGKTDEELEAALSGRVGRIVVDHRDELRRLCAIAARVEPASPPLRVLLRLNTGIEAHTHAYVRTGGEASKFGFSLGELDAAIAATLAAPRLRLAGIHSHIGSQILERDPYVANLPIALAAYQRTLLAGAAATDLVLGGGFGVDPLPGAERFAVGSLLRDLAATLTRNCAAAGIARPRIGIEPGRSVVADAGTSLYRVVAVKLQGDRRFAIVDGGIADNPRPALYDSYHHPRLANRRSAAPERDTTVCGRSCENDRLVVAALPDDLLAGDLLALETTGAYTYSMASNYNRFPKPVVVFCGGAEHRLAVRRERDADVLRNDVADA